MQTSLFGNEEEHLPIEDGCLRYFPQWLDAAEAAELFTQIKQQVEWEQSTLRLYGNNIKIPRLNAWYGDKHCSYAYSGSQLSLRPWLPVLDELRQRLQTLAQSSLNSVLVNLYRDGNDSVAWHSDDEPELGRNPLIASISLGVEREFHLRHRYKKTIKPQKLLLAHGSLLLMSGELQHHWQHQIPKVKGLAGERINLTFRHVIPASK